MICLLIVTAVYVGQEAIKNRSIKHSYSLFKFVLQLHTVYDCRLPLVRLRQSHESLKP